MSDSKPLLIAENETSVTSNLIENQLRSKLINVYNKGINEYGYTQEALGCLKDRRISRFSALTNNLNLDLSSILDFGCGLGDLVSFLSNNKISATYHGVDINQKLITQCKKEFPKQKFNAINSYTDIKTSYDFIFISGVFNDKWVENEEEQEKIIQGILTHLFQYTNHALSLNFMTTDVDFRAKNAYYQDMYSIVKFISQNLSKRMIVNTSHLRYEYTIRIFKNEDIDFNYAYKR